MVKILFFSGLASDLFYFGEYVVEKDIEPQLRNSLVYDLTGYSYIIMFANYIIIDKQINKARSVVVVSLYDGRKQYNLEFTNVISEHINFAQFIDIVRNVHHAVSGEVNR